MRDSRFIAEHRGGPLDRKSHVFLTMWAADCAERVLDWFTRCGADDRPARALKVARQWADGEIRTGVAMKASVAAHAAAREVGDPAAVAAARAAGQAVATAHFADHSMGALLYALKAIRANGGDVAEELEFQLEKLPDHLREQMESGVRERMRAMGIV